MNRSLPQYQPLLFVAVAIMAGIALDRFWSPVAATWIGIGVASLIFWPVTRRLRVLGDAGSITVLAAIVSLAGLWHHLHWSRIADRCISQLAETDPQPVFLQGRVATSARWIMPDPDAPPDLPESEIRSRFLLDVSRIRHLQETLSVDGRVEVFAPGKVLDIDIGDSVELAGTMQLVPISTNPGGLDLRHRYRQKQVQVWVRIQNARCLHRTGHGNLALRSLGLVRRHLDRQLWDYLPESQAALASAMLLGNRDQLDRQQQQQFLLSGTIHLLAISGLHVGILASFFLLLPRLGFISRNGGLLLTVVFVFAYAAVVEFRAPVVRAGVLVSIYCYCRWIGRTPFSFNALALAAIVVLVLNPMELFSAGAQLSFLAVGSIIFASQWLRTSLQDPVDRLIYNSMNRRERLWISIRKKASLAFAISGIIWLLAMPAVASQFHIVAPVALVANPLLLVPISTSLLCGLGVMLFGWCMPPLAIVFAFGCQCSLQVIQSTILVSNTLPGGQWWTCGPPCWSVNIFYMVVAGIFLFQPAIRLRTFMIGILIWMLAGWAFPAWLDRGNANERESLTGTILNVGHGSSVLLQLPGGKNLLYDCGSFGSSRKAQLTTAELLWREHTTHLDSVVISHADSDHFNGLIGLCQQFEIGEVVISDRLMNLLDEKPVFQSLVNVLRQKGIPVRTVSAGDSLQLHEKVDIRVLGPSIAGFDDSDNANSVVVEIEFQDRAILLTGDVESRGMEALLQLPPKSYCLVTAPHHGSPNSRPREFLSWATPQYIVASSSRNRHRDFASLNQQFPQTTFLHTGFAGAIQFRISAEELTVRSWCEQPW